MSYNEAIKKLKTVIPQGLVSGVGEPKPGAWCVEAAVCWALGEKHGDEPSCVAAPDRRYAIAVNDAKWSSDKARADALLPLAIAQLGTAGTDRRAWVERLVIGTANRLLPVVLRRAGLEAEAIKCESAKTLTDARTTATTAYAAAAHADASFGDEILKLSIQVALDAYAAESVGK